METRKTLEEMPAFMKFTCRKLGEKGRVRAMKEDDGRFFVFAPHKRLYGRRYATIDEFLLFHTDIRVPEQDETAWKKRLAKAGKRLEKSGLWPEFKVVIDNLQKMAMSDWKTMNDIFWSTPYGQSRAQALDFFRGKYPFVFFTDEDGNEAVHSGYFSDWAKCKTKSMYFGKYENKEIKADIKKAMKEKTAYCSGRIQANYDVSFEYQPDKKKAWYSEEFRGCGNGHYFIALDETTALHLEDD